MPEPWTLSEPEKAWLMSAGHLNAREPSTERLREHIAGSLKEAGIDPTKVEVQHVVATTVAALVSEMERQRMNALGDLLWEHRQTTEARLNYTTLFVGALGLAAAITSLLGGLEPFIRSLKELMRDLKIGGLSNILVTDAFAQGSQIAAPGTTILLPVFVYGIYLMLAVAYIGSLGGILLLKETKNRANAMEVFKNLNAFFIGAVSGKIV